MSLRHYPSTRVAQYNPRTPNQIFGRIGRVPRILAERVGMRRRLNQCLLGTRATGRPVLFIIPWMVVGGADKVHHDLIAGLAKNGIEPHIITTVPSSNPWHERFAALTPYITHLPDVLDSANHVHYITGYVRRAGIGTVLVSNSTRGYRATKPIKGQFPRLRILDLVHGEHGGFPSVSASFDAYLDGRIVVSEYLKEQLVLRHGTRPDRIAVIHNGIDVEGLRQQDKDAACYRRRLGIQPEAFVVAYVGRFAVEKRPDRVVESFAGLRRERSQIPMRLIMAGGGELHDALIAQANALDIVTEVHFPGYVDDVPTLLAACDVLVLSSETEGIPIVVLEAMSLGVPVVATAVGGVPEIIQSGRSGLLVKNDDQASRGITSHLLTLLDDGHWRHRIGQEAALRVQDEFSLTRMVEQYSELL